ncbi:MAG: hypothetical protein GC149_18440 [Gammaproteobacteria bacterium]|nr:hypothetical protein [Gammaproteobacteria bacterium]
MHMNSAMGRYGRNGYALFFLLGISLLTGCGGGGSAPAPSEGQATLGATGGVVQGPDGVTVSVPTGALKSDVTLRVARDGTGAPPPPAGFGSTGSVYQFTPHGELFDSPVTISLPVATASLEPGAVPMFFHAQPGDQWIQIVDAQLANGMLSAPSLSFSYGNVYIGYVNPNTPIAQRHSIKDFALVAPTGLPLANGWLPTLNQPTTITIRATFDPDFITNRCSTWPTIELARAIKTVNDNYPPPSWAYVPLGSQMLGSSYQLDFNVALDQSHNGFDWFIAKFDCPLKSTVLHTNFRWFLFGYARVKVDIPLTPGAPTITQQPQSVTAAEGTSASFSLAASAPDSLVVQWQRSNDNGVTWNTVASGVNMTTYTLTPVQTTDNGARFRANVCNALGVQLNCISSDTVILTVTASMAAPVFTTQPQSLTIQTGQTASFTAVASGTPSPDVQWYRVGSSDVAVGALCAAGTGATSCTYTTPALTVTDSGSEYYALAQNSNAQVQSTHVTVTVQTGAVAPTITTDPLDQTVTEGGNLTFTVVADGTAPLSYQWYRNNQAIPGASAATLDLTNVQVGESGDQFYVEVGNGAGTVTSMTATLTVTPAAGACSTAQLIESGTGDAAEPHVLLDTAGNATAVWSQFDGSKYSIFSNLYTAGSGWGTAQAIDHTVVDTGGPVMAMDGSGNVVAAWQGMFSVYANHDTAGSGWGNSVDWYDGTAVNAASAPQVALAANGKGVAVWQRFDGTADSVYARQYTGSGWGAVQTIDSDASHPASTPDVAVDASGNAIAVWRQSNGTTYGAYYNVFNGTEWGTAQPIATTSGEVQPVHVAMNASGQAVAIWSQNDGAAYGVYAAIYTLGSGWSTPTTLDPGSIQGVNPAIAIDANGGAIAVWEQWDGVGHRIYVRRYVPGTGWAAIEQLQNTLGLGDAWEPSIAMDASGNAIVVWMQWQSTTFGIFGNRYTAGSGWGGAVLLSDATNDVTTPRVGLGSSGAAMVVWREGDGASQNIKATRCP